MYKEELDSLRLRGDAPSGYSDDLLYDIVEGGHFKPREYLPEDSVEAVELAIAVVKKYVNLLENKIEIG